MIDPMTASIVIVLGKYALDKGTELAREAGPTAKEWAGKLFDTVMERLRRDPKGEVVADEFVADPETYQKPLEKKLKETIQADITLAEQLKTLLTQYEAAVKAYAAVTDSSYTASLKGSGAIAQGGGDALGERAVKAGDVHGPIITGSGNVIHSGRSSASSVTLPSTLAPLRDKLGEYFNRSELKALCFDLGVAHDDLPGETRTELAQALVEHCHERGRLAELIRRCQTERPKVDWR